MYKWLENNSARAFLVCATAIPLLAACDVDVETDLRLSQIVEAYNGADGTASLEIAGMMDTLEDCEDELSHVTDIVSDFVPGVHDSYCQPLNNGAHLVIESELPLDRTMRDEARDHIQRQSGRTDRLVSLTVAQGQNTALDLVMIPSRGALNALERMLSDTFFSEVSLMFSWVAFTIHNDIDRPLTVAGYESFINGEPRLEFSHRLQPGQSVEIAPSDVAVALMENGGSFTFATLSASAP